MSIKTLSLVIGLVMTIVGATVTVLLWQDERYAFARDHKRLENRVSLNEANDAYRDALREMYFLREQARRYPMDPDIKDRLDEAEKQVGVMNKYIKLLENNIR